VSELRDIKDALDRSTIVATTDRHGTITYANDKFCEISGYAREELIGQNHRIINSGHHSPEFFKEMWRTIGGGYLWHAEIRNRAKDGSYYWVDTTIVPFLDRNGRPHQYIAIRHDITARKRAEAEIVEQSALTQLGQMAAVVAHELKNPLAGLRGALEIIGRRMSAESSDRRIVGEMVARIDSLNQMVQDLLVFARPTEPRRAPTSVGEIVSETVGLLAVDAEMREVEVDVRGANPVVSADAMLIKGTLLNLLINAAQAIGRRGRIDVSIVEADGHCRIGIADRGPGIPAEIHDKVFEPFFTTKHRGTGLGLPVARRTVERHGGRLWFECPPDGGTVMFLTLPLAGS
jgi:two-component system CheB/CheR fusion protein